MAGAVGKCRRPVGAFNPVWCLRLQTPGKKSTTRWLEEGSPALSTPSSMHTLCGRRKQARRSSDASAEPLSPRVGCMGQVKEGREAGGGSPQVIIRNKFQRLRRIFSARSVSGAAAVADSLMTKAEACSVIVPRISMAELDPPLPVVKRVARGVEAVSLWKRRCGEVPVPEGIQLRPQRQPHTHWLAPPSEGFQNWQAEL